jgi:Ca2+-binding EF-hand superfamily protein
MNLDDTLAKNLITEADTDKDGKISMIEFK